MKKFFIVFYFFLIVLTLPAQKRAGSIYGIVVDQEGIPLPGVNLVLTGPTIAPMTAQSNAEGIFRFLSLFPSKEYVIKAELQGFKTRTEKGIIVSVNKDSDIKVVMEQGALEVEITVVGQIPMIQVKKTEITHTVGYEQLQGLASTRDPWAFIQLTPSVFIDRENVGGVESGGQPEIVAKMSEWMQFNMDGMEITDRESGAGGSATYYDFDSIEEVNISTGMLDVENRYPGVTVNIVTRRGGNKTNLGGRFYWTNEKFQKEINDEKLAEIGVSGYNRAVDIKDFGFNAGGSIFKDKVWWWVAYGVQQIQTYNILDRRDDTYLNNYLGKLNFQLIPGNRLELFFQAGDKKKFGRDSQSVFPPGWDQHCKYYFGNPLFKIQDEHMFGDNLFVSIRLGSSNSGLGLWPANDPDIEKFTWYDVEKSLYYDSLTWIYDDRPHPYYVFQLQYFNDDFFGTGMSHEIKIGAEINNSRSIASGGYPGNFYVQDNFYYETVDWDNDGSVDIVRDIGPNIKRIYLRTSSIESKYGTNRIGLYLNDTMSFGRFNLNLGLRADRSKQWVDPVRTRSLWTGPGDGYFANYADIATQLFTPETINKIAPLLPEKERGYLEPGKLFWMFSPRIGLTCDVFGDGKTIAKVAYALYPGDGLGTSYWSPSGLSGSLNFWWADLNSDGKADWTELYWVNANLSSNPVYRAFDDNGNFAGNWAREEGAMWSGWDLSNPLGLSKPTSYIDLDNWKTDLTHELYLSVEREIIQDIGVSLGFSWKRHGRFSWSPYYYPDEFFPGLNNHIRSPEDWMVAGYVPDVLIDPNTGQTWDPKEAKGRPWYVLKNLPECGYTPYTIRVMMDPGRYDVYWGWDLVFNKRLSHKWMLNGSFTYQKQKSHYGESTANRRTAFDPTDKWAYDNQIYAPDMGFGTGKINRPHFSYWLFKLSGLYMLPLDINVSATLSAREGSYYAESFVLQDRTLPNSRSYSTTMPTVKFDNRNQLPSVWTMNLKVEKMIKLGDTARMYFSADIFNALNQNTMLRQRDISYGTFRFEDTTPIRWSAPSSTSGQPYEIMNPLVLRLGVRFQL